MFQPVAGNADDQGAANASIQLDNNALEITMPDGRRVTLPDGQRLPLKNGSIRTDDVMAPRPNGEIRLSAAGDLGPFIEAIEELPIRAVRDASPCPKREKAKSTRSSDVKLPFIPNVTGDDMIDYRQSEAFPTAASARSRDASTFKASRSISI